MADGFEFQGRRIDAQQVAGCVRETANLAGHCRIVLTGAAASAVMCLEVEATPDANIEEKKIQAAYRLGALIEKTTGVIAAIEVASAGAMPDTPLVVDDRRT